MVYIPPQTLFSLLTGALKLSDVGYRAIEKAISKGGATSGLSYQDFRKVIGEYLPRGMEGSFSIQESRRPPSTSDTLRNIETPDQSHIPSEREDDITLEERGESATFQEQVLRHNIQALAERLSHYTRNPDATVEFECSLQHILLPIPTSDDYWLWSVKLDESGRIVGIFSTSSDQLTRPLDDEMRGVVDIVLRQTLYHQAPTLLWYDEQFPQVTPQQYHAMQHLFGASVHERESLLQKHPFFLDEPLSRVGQKPSTDNYAPLLRDLQEIVFQQNRAAKTQFEVIFFKEHDFPRALAIDQERGGVFPRIEASATIQLDGQDPILKVRTQRLNSHNQDETYLRGIERVLRYVEALSATPGGAPEAIPEERRSEGG